VNSKFCSYSATYYIPVWQSARKKWRYDFKPTKEVLVYHTGVGLYRLTSSPEHPVKIIGVGDRGRGGHMPPPQKKKKIGKKYFSGNYYVTFGHFSGKIM